jgi:hypothetical protein
LTLRFKKDRVCRLAPSTGTCPGPVPARREIFLAVR